CFDHVKGPTSLYLGALYLTLLIIIRTMPATISTTDISCATRISLVSIKLSVRKPSTKNLPIEYKIRYSAIVSPIRKFFLNEINISNSSISHIDSYKNVG